MQMSDNLESELSLFIQIHFCVCVSNLLFGWVNVNDTS